MEELTSKVADYVATARSDDLPPAVWREAQRALFNIVGCTIGGAHHPTVKIADDALAPFAGAPQATLFCRSRKSDLLHVALINCLASAVNTFDDTLDENLVHPSGSVAAAILGLTEHRAVSGRELLTAFALGVEMVCRLSRATTVPSAKGNIGWGATAVTGGIGAAVAAGKLLNLDASRLRSAIGIALSQASGFRVMHGSMCQSMIHAYPAQAGLRAALLAERGFTSSPVAIEGRLGYLSVFSDEPNPAALTGDLGERFEILRNTYKPYPAGIVIHPIIDASLQLNRTGVEAAKIARVTIEGSPGAIAICNWPRPQGQERAMVSLQHWTAVAFIRGKAGLPELDEATIANPDVLAFQDKIKAVADPSVAADAAVVKIEMADGSRHEARVLHGIGSAKRPLTDAELEMKFLDQAELVVGAKRARALADMSWSVDGLPDAGDLPRAAA